jgi:hypothetical protein
VITIERVLQHVRGNFYERLEAKTNWGRNELKMEFERAVNSVIVDFLDRAVKEIQGEVRLLKKQKAGLFPFPRD